MTREMLLAGARAAELAATAQTPEQERAAVMEVMRQREAIAIGMMYSRIQRMSETPHRRECLPLRDEGDDIGQVEARLPAEFVMRLAKQKNFGMEGLFSDEGMRDMLKAIPSAAVKTVSGKTVVGWKPTEVRGERAEGRGRDGSAGGTPAAR